jgi:hypothetical protein
VFGLVGGSSDRRETVAGAEGRWCGAPETASGASGLRLPPRGEFEPFLGTRTSLPRSLTSTASRSKLLRSIITSPSLLVPLGMRSSERRALLKRLGRSAQHRCQLRGARPCMPYHAFSSGCWRFDSLRVHRARNDRTRVPTAPLRSRRRASRAPRRCTWSRVAAGSSISSPERGARRFSGLTPTLTADLQPAASRAVQRALLLGRYAWGAHLRGASPSLSAQRWSSLGEELGTRLT